MQSLHTNKRVGVILHKVTRLKFSNTVPPIGKHLIVKTLQTITPDEVESVNSHLEVRQKRIESRLNNSIEIEVDVDVDCIDLDDDPEELKILLKHRVHPAANKRPNGN
ncbi:2145_t:CDS:2 [Entrophospora sp. SA101]|nr:2145_t:CDS:2 [Entrophospora sp. SA101]